MEHAHEQHERDRVSYMTDNLRPAGRQRPDEVAEGRLRDRSRHFGESLFRTHARPAGGHDAQRRPGGVLPQRSGADTTHLEPTWTLGYDLYPLESIDNKHRFYELAIPENWFVVFTHDAKTPWTYLGRNEKGLPVARAVQEQ